MGAMLQKAICKTIGLAGMSLVAYDAYSVGRANSSRAVHQSTADHFEKIIADTNTTDVESPVQSAMQKRVANLRLNNPFVPAYNKTKGFVKGVFKTLGDNIIPVGLSAVALAGKGKLAKAGACGVVLYGLYTIAKEGFGFGKVSPMK